MTIKPTPPHVQPPYATIESFYECLRYLKGTPLPVHITAESIGLKERAGTWSHIQSTLRALGLISLDNAPTDSLRRLVAAIDSGEWPVALQKVVLAPYQAWLGGLPAEEFTPAILEERFRARGCTAQATIEKAVRFCLAIHRDAGLVVPRKPLSRPTKSNESKNASKGTQPRAFAQRHKLPANHQEYPFQLRQDVEIHIALPRDITLAEVKRFAKFLETIPLPN